MADVTVQKRGEVYQYKFEIASIDGKRKFKNKSGFATKSEAKQAGIIAYNEYLNTGHSFKPKTMSYSDYLDYWMEHISTMSHLRDGIGLRGYANTSPLQAYKMEWYQLFDEMIAKINRDISIYLLKSEIRQNIERKQVAKNAITNDSKDHAKVQKKSTKVGRNDPCPCGSGKKYKNCCGK